jgi:hypothetical protein
MMGLNLKRLQGEGGGRNRRCGEAGEWVQVGWSSLGSNRGSCCCRRFWAFWLPVQKLGAAGGSRLLGRRIRLVVVTLGLGEVTVDGVPEVRRDSGRSCPRGLILSKLERESSLD